MRYVLDTDVLYQLSKEAPNPAVLRWIELQDDATLFLSAATLAEIRYGVELKTSGKKRDHLEQWLTQDLPAQFSGRILPIEQHAADLAGRIMARAKKEGWELKAMDAYIAATAMVNDMALATLNRRHFEPLGVDLLEF